MDLWEIAEYAGETLVFIGVVLEVVAEWREPENKRQAKIGSVVLVIGLAISLAALIGTNEYFNGTIADLNLKASQASERGSKAELEAAKLRTRAEELEERILEVGPRDLILYGKRANTLVQSLEPFKGQKVEVRICNFNDKETRDTANRLMVLLRQAKWNVDDPGSDEWGEPNCGFPPVTLEAGLWVGMPNSSPSAITIERAKKLLESLQAVPLAAKPHVVFGQIARARWDSRPGPKVYEAPDDIVVVVMLHSSPPPESGPYRGLGFGP
jgi:hypothetical protein